MRRSRARENEVKKLLSSDAWKRLQGLSPKAVEDNAARASLTTEIRRLLYTKPVSSLVSEFEAYLKTAERDISLPKEQFALEADKPGLCWVKFRGFPFWPAKVSLKLAPISSRFKFPLWFWQLLSKLPAGIKMSDIVDEGSKSTSKTHTVIVSSFPEVEGKEIKYLRVLRENSR